MGLSTVAAVSAMLAMAAPHPDASLNLTVQDQAGNATSVTLECGPPGGSHPHPGRACWTLESVNGNFDRLPSQHQFCPMIYAPVTVTATGRWHHRLVRFHRDYSNRCLANVATANVFDFSQYQPSN